MITQPQAALEAPLNTEIEAVNRIAAVIHRIRRSLRDRRTREIHGQIRIDRTARLQHIVPEQIRVSNRKVDTWGEMVDS